MAFTPRGLYAIVDHPDPSGHRPADVVEALARGGATCIQLRAKGASSAQRLSLALEMGPVARDLGVPLIIDDDLDVALAGIDGVAGVHLGREDLDVLRREGTTPELIRTRVHGAGLWLGISTHSLAQFERAMALGADYAGFGPVFSTTSKKDPDPVVGLEGVERASKLGDLPLVAIGGIDPERARQCARAGAAAVAVISALRDPTLEGVRARATEFARRLS